MRAYIIRVEWHQSGRTEVGISQEGYESLKAAQSFIEHRADKPTQISPYWYRSDESQTDYRIYEVRIVKEV